MTTKKFDEAASKKQAAELAENLVEHKAKRFVCSVCGYTVIAATALLQKNHQKNVHSAVK